MCRKIAHSTRRSAERQLKAVLWRNASRHEDERSKGLTVYRCPACCWWHVGHAVKKEKEKEGDPCR